MRPWPVALALCLLFMLPAAPAPAAAGPTVQPLVVDVDGESAHGLIAHPEGEPTALVLILHGYGHKAESHRGHLEALAARGAIAVAMDFRGEGFPLTTGAADSCAAFQPIVQAHPDVPSHLFSVSMGTAVAALVLPACPVFDAWVVSEGLSMLHETWAGATLLSPSGNPTAVQAAVDIEAECNGAPAASPACYVARSAALRVPDMVTDCAGAAASACRELGAVHLLHGLNDGLVPYNQGRELVAALRTAGIASDFTTVVRGEPCQEGTTLTGYLGLTCTGLAGHGTESNDDHTLTKLSFDILYALVDGTLDAPADREFVLDEEFGLLP